MSLIPTLSPATSPTPGTMPPTAETVAEIASAMDALRGTPPNAAPAGDTHPGAAPPAEPPEKLEPEKAPAKPEPEKAPADPLEAAAARRKARAEAREKEREPLSALMARERALREREGALEGQVKRAREEARAEVVRQLREDPDSLLRDTGIQKKDLAVRLVKGPDPAAQATAKAEELAAKVERLEAEVRERAAEAELARLRSDIRTMVDQGQDWPLLKRAGAHDMVYEAIRDHYDRTEEVLSQEEAADMVESYLSGLRDRLTDNGSSAPAAKPQAKGDADRKPDQGRAVAEDAAVRTSPEEDALLGDEEAMERAARFLRAEAP